MILVFEIHRPRFGELSILKLLKLMLMFVLEVAALHAIGAWPRSLCLGFLMSRLHGNQPARASNSANGTICALELVHDDHAPLAPGQTLSRRSSSAVGQLVAT